MDINESLNEMQKLLDELPPLMSEKGVVNPVADLDLISQQKCLLWLKSSVSKGVPTGSSGLKRIEGDTFTDLIAKARVHIAALPDPGKSVFNRHMARVAKVIDDGRDDGIADEFIEPLTVVVAAMSKNLLAAD